MWARRDQASLPGSWRGAPPVAGGQGSMAGPRGGTMTAPVRGQATWSPTVANLLVLIALEIVAYCVLRYAFRTVHGG
jgi:hypothetical protein